MRVKVILQFPIFLLLSCTPNIEKGYTTIKTPIFNSYKNLEIQLSNVISITPDLYFSDYNSDVSLNLEAFFISGTDTSRYFIDALSYFEPITKKKSDEFYFSSLEKHLRIFNMIKKREEAMKVKIPFDDLSIFLLKHDTGLIGYCVSKKEGCLLNIKVENVKDSLVLNQIISSIRVK
jgi:hypothetical protein